MPIHKEVVVVMGKRYCQPTLSNQNYRCCNVGRIEKIIVPKNLPRQKLPYAIVHTMTNFGCLKLGTVYCENCRL